MSLPVMSVEHTPADEGDYGVFVIRLDKPATETIQLHYRALTGNGLGTIALDGLSDHYDSDDDIGFDTGQQHTLTIAPGETTATIRVYANSNGADTPDQSYTLEFYDLQGAEFARGGSVLRTSGIVLDTDGGVDRAVVVGAPILVEGDSGTQVARFEVRLSRPFDVQTTVQYATLDGTAKAGSDYTAKSGSLTFAAGQTSTYVDVVVKGDTAGEAAETFSLKVTPPSGAPSNLTSIGTATILNDDTASALPSISVEHISADEGDYGVFVIRLDKPATETIQLHYRALTGNGLGTIALNGLSDHYDSDDDIGFDAGQQHTLTIAPGETTATIRVFVNQNFAETPDQSYTLEFFDLQGAEFARGGSVLRTSGIVLDTDGGVDRAVVVGAPILVEGDSGTQVARFEVRLSRPFDVQTTVQYATLDGTAKAGSDYTAKSGSLTFAAGQTSTYVDVVVQGDTAGEAAETFSLKVTPPSGAPSNLTSIGTATILNNDTASALPSISVEHISADEGDYGVFVIRLDKPATETIQLHYRALTGNGLGTIALNGLSDHYDSDDDIGFDAGQQHTLTIAAGETTATIRVYANSNGADTPDQSYTLEFYDLQGADFAGGGAILRRTGVVLDTDGAANDRTLVGQQVIQRDAGPNQDSMTFEIRLTRPSDLPTKIAYSTANGSAQAGINYVATSGTITIAAGATSAFVTVPLLDDPLGDLGKTFTLKVKPTLLGGQEYQIGAIIQKNDTYGTDLADNIVGKVIDDVIFGRGGNDTLSGLAGGDLLNGGSGNDTISGGDGNDRLEGSGGADFLSGGAGVDRLFGGAGGDVLRGGTGKDQMTGGSGTDRFVFANGEMGGTVQTGTDRILDFRQGDGDRIDLRLVDANTNLAGDQAFAFIGSAAFGKVAGQLRAAQVNGNTYLFGDTDGDGAANFTIRLDGLPSLQAADFML